MAIKASNILQLYLHRQFAGEVHKNLLIAWWNVNLPRTTSDVNVSTIWRATKAKNDSKIKSKNGNDADWDTRREENFDIKICIRWKNKRKRKVWEKFCHQLKLNFKRAMFVGVWKWINFSFVISQKKKKVTKLKGLIKFFPLFNKSLSLKLILQLGLWNLI